MIWMGTDRVMVENKIRTIINDGEGLRIEFKTCSTAVPKNVYHTVCAFLNRYGGEILLGVTDKGQIEGIKPDSIDKIKTGFITAVNNPEKLSPPVYLAVEQLKIDGKIVLYIYVPQSSQVHSCNGKIYDRNQDGDLDITKNPSAVENLYLNKQNLYTENKVYPYCTLADLNTEAITYARKMAVFQKTNHPWKTMDDFDSDAGFIPRSSAAQTEEICYTI
jgi:ATP-dependent DNA helicase RecG